MPTVFQGANSLLLQYEGSKIMSDPEQMISKPLLSEDNNAKFISMPKTYKTFLGAW